MKALGDQAVGLGNNSVEGMIKSILDCTSHVPNSEPLQLPSLCLECRVPHLCLSFSCLLQFKCLLLYPQFLWKMLLAAIMWSPKLFTLVLELFVHVSDSSIRSWIPQRAETVSYSYLRFLQHLAWHLVHSEVQQCLLN